MEKHTVSVMCDGVGDQANLGAYSAQLRTRARDCNKPQSGRPELVLATTSAAERAGVTDVSPPLRRRLK